MNIREKTPKELKRDLDQFNEVLPSGLRDQLQSVNKVDSNPNLRENSFSDELSKGLFLKVLRHLRAAKSLGRKGGAIEQSIVSKQLLALESARQYILQLSTANVAGNPLREIQKLAALGFYEWLKSEILNRSLMGHLVLPMGSGKTNTAVLFSEMVGGKTIFFSPNNSIGDQTADAFNRHYSFEKREGKFKTVGIGYRGKEEIEKDFLITNFQSIPKWESKVDWKSVRLMVCDEADINALSDSRREWIREISEKYGIIVVGMSATEEQSSGKKLHDVFPGEIARMPIPESLPQCLEMNLIPQLKFHDMYLDVEWKIDFNKLRQNKDIEDDEVDRLIQSTSWNKMILDHYVENFAPEGKAKQPGLVIFRNNNLVDDFIKQAKEKGIAAAAYTGTTSEEERTELRKKVANGKLQLLVGSNLLGRGLDIPELNVVYNSTVTYSPQIFWQADGRGFRIDENASGKMAHLIAVLPQRMIKESDFEELLSHQRPLCHAAFFDRDYFVGEECLVNLDENVRRKYRKKKRGVPIHQFDLSRCEIIRSIAEVGRVIRGLWVKGPDFQSRAEIIAGYLNSLDSHELTMKMVFDIIRTRNAALKSFTRKLEKMDPNQAEENENVPSRVLPDGCSLTLGEEKELMNAFQDNKNSENPGARKKAAKAKDLLIRGHLPLVISVAKKFVSEKVEWDDLVQEGIISLNETIERFDRHRAARMASFALIRIYRNMEYFVGNHSRSVVVPTGIHSNAHKLLRLWETIKNKSANKIEAAETVDQPNIDLLSQKSGLDREKIKIILKTYFMKEVSLDETDHVIRDSALFLRQEKEVITHGDALTYEENGWNDMRQDPEKNTANLDTGRLIRKKLATLTPREEVIMKMLFGLSKPEGKELSREEVGSIFGFTAGNVGEIQKKALKKLRHPFRSTALARTL